MDFQADFAEKYGYPAESHVVSTEDGYMLTIHRVPFGRNNTNYNRPVVLVQHGIVLTSDQWVLRGPEDLGTTNQNRIDAVSGFPSDDDKSQKKLSIQL